MPRRAAKVDSNQPEIVSALRKAGCSVLLLHMVGNGCPDIAVGHRGSNYLFELKDPSRPLSARKLTPDEQQFIEQWRGHVSVITSVEEALKIMEAI